MSYNGMHLVLFSTAGKFGAFCISILHIPASLPRDRVMQAVTILTDKNYRIGAYSS
jgi:hypothetical protein